MCLLCLQTQALTSGHNQSPLRLDKPREFSRTPRSASATEGCQEGPRESRGDRVMSHDKRNCPEAITWHVQPFLSCWSSRTFLSSGLRRFFFSVSRPRAASPRCVSAACTASSCHLECRRESSMVCALFSLTPLYGVQLLPRQFDESSNSHCSAQPTSSSWTSPVSFSPERRASDFQIVLAWREGMPETPRESRGVKGLGRVIGVCSPPPLNTLAGLNQFRTMTL